MQVNKKIVILLFSAVLLLSSPLAWSKVVQKVYSTQVFESDKAPAAPVVIVFGAGLRRNGGLTSILRDRMDVAIALYRAGKVKKLLLSGDNRFVEYNEPGAMVEYALSQEVRKEDIQPDYGGRRTYDTCYRAKHIFQVEAAILVTQQFHLPRALFNCRQLGIEAVGVASDLRQYRGAGWFAAREVAATVQSAWDVVQRKPSPVMGEIIPITQ